MGCFLKALPNVKSAYVTCKEFTPNLQIFYTFLIFGFDVQVSGLKLPQWNTFIEFGLNVQVSHWNWPFSQSFTQRQKRVCYYQKIYPRPPKNLHRLICRICDISQLWVDPCGPFIVTTNICVTTFLSRCNNKYLIFTLLQPIHIVTTIMCCNNIVTTNTCCNNIVTTHCL